MFKRPPDFIIGPTDNPYLLRWWIIPRNKYFNIYLHKFLRSDDDRALHDHPWASCSILLKGEYLEEIPARPTLWKIKGNRETIKYLRKPFRPVLRGPDAIHRVELLRYFDGSLAHVWTIFITGPWKRNWGFWCPKGWKPWREFVNVREGEAKGNEIGAGCDDA